MKFSKLIALIIMTFTAFSAYAESNYKVVSSYPLNVRESPSKDANVLGRFDCGQQIEVIRVDGNWAKVKFNGNTGYVLTEYIQPIPVEPISISKQSKQSSPETSNSEVMHVNKSNDDTFESDRKSSFIEVGYSASSFEDVKLSGSYGISWTIFPWKIASESYLGIHFSPLNVNFGLVDSDYTTDIIKVGPSLGVYITPKICVAVNLDAMCVVYFESDDTKTAWGMSLEPAIYLGSSAGIYVGPQFTMSFEGDSKIDCGFRAGIYF